MERQKQKVIVQENREKKAYQDSKDRFKREELMKGIGQTVVDVKQEQLHQQQQKTQVLQKESTSKLLQTTKNDKNHQQQNNNHPQNLPIEHRNHHAKQNAVQSAVQQSAHEMAAKKTMSMTTAEIKILKFRFRSIIR